MTAVNTDLDSPRNNGTEDPTEWNLSPIGSRGTPKHRRAIRDDVWQAAVAKGRALWNQLQSVLRDPLAVDAVVCDLGDRWDVWDETAYPHSLGKKWYSLLPLGAVSNPQPTKAFTMVDITAPKKPAGYKSGVPFDGWYYENSYSPTHGIIVALDTVGILWTDSAERAPDRWSDVTWDYWKVICASEGKDPKDLAYVLQEGIINHRTQDIQDHISWRRHGMMEHSKHQDVVVPGTEEFDALLSSPNVIGTIHMLMRNVNALGRKTIKRIGSVGFTELDYRLWIELENVAAMAQPGLQSSDTITTA